MLSDFYICDSCFYFLICNAAYFLPFDHTGVEASLGENKRSFAEVIIEINKKNTLMQNKSSNNDRMYLNESDKCVCVQVSWRHRSSYYDENPPPSIYFTRLSVNKTMNQTGGPSRLSSKSNDAHEAPSPHLK